MSTCEHSVPSTVPGVPHVEDPEHALTFFEVEVLGAGAIPIYVIEPYEPYLTLDEDRVIWVVVGTRRIIVPLYQDTTFLAAHALQMLRMAGKLKPVCSDPHTYFENLNLPIHSYFTFQNEHYAITESKFLGCHPIRDTYHGLVLHNPRGVVRISVDFISKK